MPVINEFGEKIETMPEIDARLQATFNMLDEIAKGVVSGAHRAVTCTGRAGCGKTFAFESALQKAQDQGKIRLDMAKGTMTGVNLYKKLYANKDADNVLMVDDCDAVFADLESVNMLKNALDTSKRRVVQWNKESKVLAAEGIDREHEFEGSIVFISNIDFVRAIDKKSKMSPHYAAFISRCMFVDIGIHTNMEVYVRLTQVGRSKAFLQNMDVSKEDVQKILAWIYKNINRVFSLSIRTLERCVNLHKAHGSRWVKIAEMTELRR